jgi:hypothetical protein
MGRPAKPTAQLKLHGKFRKDRHGARVDADAAAIGKPEMPSDLSGEAKWCWNQHYDQAVANGAGKADAVLLAGMCKWYARWCHFEAMLVEKPDDYRVLNMAVTSWKQYCEIATKFGFSPVDRTKIKKADAPPQSKLTKFIS